MVYGLPWRGRDEDELSEEMRVGDGSEEAHHSGKRVTNEDARFDLKLFQNGQ